MARYCPACGHPTQSHDRACLQCDAVLLKDPEAREAQARFEQLPAAMKQDLEREFNQRCREWSHNRDFYDRKSVWKHVIGGAIVFGVAGLASGPMAIGYAVVGALGGKVLNRRKGGLFLGTLVGAGVFVAVLAVRTIVVLMMKIDTEAFLMNVAFSHYADRIAGLVCPAAGGLLGYLIENEFDAKG
jgi:hypothetical protein